MALIRFVVDIEAAGDVTAEEGDAMREKIQKYADSVLGVQHLGNKQGDDTASWWHVHKCTRDYSCDDCRQHAADERR